MAETTPTSPTPRARLETLRRATSLAVLPAVWAVLPLVVGPELADALDDRSRPVQLVVSVGSWSAWAVVLVATMVPRTVSLTVLRVVAPGAPALAAWAAAVTPEPGLAAAAALGAATLANVVAFLPGTGDRFVNGSSYGDERRMPLRVPGPILLGPLQLTWAAVAAGAVTGPLLLAAGEWVAAVPSVLVGALAVRVGLRSLHMLSCRWLVFVPAGMVLVDPLVLTDALAMPRRLVASFGPAPVDTDAHDLTAGALGMALRVRLTETQTIVPVARGRLRRSARTVEPVEVDEVLLTPTMPGAALTEAHRRGLPIG